jgi:hypothetical protein
MEVDITEFKVNYLRTTPWLFSYHHCFMRFNLVNSSEVLSFNIIIMNSNSIMLCLPHDFGVRMSIFIHYQSEDSHVY